MQITIRNNNDQFEYAVGTQASWQPLPADIRARLADAAINFDRISPGTSITLNSYSCSEASKAVILELACPTVNVTGDQIEVINILEISPIIIEVTLTTNERWPSYAVTGQPDGTLEVQVHDHSTATIGNLPFSFQHYESQNKDQLTVLLIADEALGLGQSLLLWQRDADS
ncbi:MAG: hypothetical protein JST84_05340 [Acidobacteria bacterium]|nr:hypothetical protein [Acidobacteriota bacterium]